ncbi:MAG TPA: hypothetical protein VF470_06755 [Sphingomicrobium sp.]|jgi:hypothetical protein
MKSKHLIASFVALGLIAGPAAATTTAKAPVAKAKVHKVKAAKLKADTKAPKTK